MNKVDAKKKELENKLSRIQVDLDQSLQEVKEDVGQTVTPKEIIRRFPLPVVGAAVFIGFVLGNSGSSKKTSKKNSAKSSNTIVDSITQSVKKKVTQKAVDAAMNYVEQKLGSRGGDEHE